MNNDKSPFFKANEYRPTMEGPFECRPVEAPDSTHMRWFDATQQAWSYPLNYDELLDDEMVKPPAEEFIVTLHPDELDEHLRRFEWRGYNDDQSPL